MSPGVLNRGTVAIVSAKWLIFFASLGNLTVVVLFGLKSLVGPAKAP